MNLDWLCASMLWSIAGFPAGVGVGYLTCYIQHHLGGKRT